MEKLKIGVVIGRFHTDKLTEGHKFLLSSVLKESDKLVVILGESVTKLNRKHQLPAYIRVKMIKETYPQAEIYWTHDKYENDEWSRKVDSIITENLPYGEADIKLYHSRDGFGDSYTGKFPVICLNTPIQATATERRQLIADGFFNNDASFRRGIIWASYNKWPTTFPCVDIGIVKFEGYPQFPFINEKSDLPYYKILLGKKTGETQWRLPGGFVDISDESLEAAALREMKEETGNINHHGLQYVSSQKVNDWRYKDTGDGIMTTLFTCVKMSGQEKGGDDLPEIKWVPLLEAEAEVFDGHKGLIKKLIKFYQ